MESAYQSWQKDIFCPEFVFPAASCANIDGRGALNVCGCWEMAKEKPVLCRNIFIHGELENLVFNTAVGPRLCTSLRTGRVSGGSCHRTWYWQREPLFSRLSKSCPGATMRPGQPPSSDSGINIIHGDGQNRCPNHQFAENRARASAPIFHSHEFREPTRFLELATAKPTRQSSHGLVSLFRIRVVSANSTF